MIELSFLQPGDTVDIIAPAGKSDPETLHQVSELLASWHLQANIPSNILGEDLLCANSDEVRFALLKEALFSTDSKAIWCLRGGYGSMRLIPQLEQLTPPNKQKLFIGFSDITALHIFLQEKWGWKTIHASSAQQVAMGTVDANSSQQIKNLLFGKTKAVKFFDLMALNQSAKQMKKIDVPIVGGNLTLVECSLGTSWQLTTQQKILFLEDVNMPAYQIDRSLEHLKQAGIFKNVSAILLGDFIDNGTKKDPELIEKILQHFADELSVPVLRIPNIGHGKTNYVLPLGVTATLSNSAVVLVMPNPTLD